MIVGFKNILVVVLLLLVLPAFAQLEVGAKAGVNYGNVQISKIENTNISEMLVDNHAGFHFGLFARIDIIKIYLQPEFIFTQINADVNVKGANNVNSREKYQLNRLDVPLSIGLKLGDFRIFMGPVASFNLNPANAMFNDVYSQGSWSLMGGVGFNFWKMNVELKYEGAVTEYSTEASVKLGDEIHEVPLDVRNSQFVLSFGYTFGQK